MNWFPPSSQLSPGWCSPRARTQRSPSHAAHPAPERAAWRGSAGSSVLHQGTTPARLRPKGHPPPQDPRCPAPDSLPSSSTPCPALRLGPSSSSITSSNSRSSSPSSSAMAAGEGALGDGAAPGSGPPPRSRCGGHARGCHHPRLLGRLGHGPSSPRSRAGTQTSESWSQAGRGLDPRPGFFLCLRGGLRRAEQGCWALLGPGDPQG